MDGPGTDAAPSLCRGRQGVRRARCLGSLVFLGVLSEHGGALSLSTRANGTQLLASRAAGHTCSPDLGRAQRGEMWRELGEWPWWGSRSAEAVLQRGHRLPPSGAPSGGSAGPEENPYSECHHSQLGGQDGTPAGLWCLGSLMKEEEDSPPGCPLA